MDNDVNTAAMVHYTGISHDDLNFHWVSTNRVMNPIGTIAAVLTSLSIFLKKSVPAQLFLNL